MPLTVSVTDTSTEHLRLGLPQEGTQPCYTCLSLDSSIRGSYCECAEAPGTTVIVVSRPSSPLSISFTTTTTDFTNSIRSRPNSPAAASFTAPTEGSSGIVTHGNLTAPQQSCLGFRRLCMNDPYDTARPRMCSPMQAPLRVRGACEDLRER